MGRVIRIDFTGATPVCEFLQVLTSVTPDSRAWICAFEHSPAKNSPDWGGALYDASESPLDVADSNAYYSVAVFPETAQRRKADEALSVAVIVCEDVGTKAQPQAVKALLGSPSYRIETSPGNEQWGYLLTRGATIHEARAIHAGLKDHSLTDESGMTPVRYARLPAGINNKPDYAEPFHVRLRYWMPTRRFDPNAILAVLGTTKDASPPRKKQARLTELDRNELREALKSIPNSLDRDEWVNVGMALRHELGDDGLADWVEFSRRWKDYDAADTLRVWKSLQPRGDRTAGTIFKLAIDHGYKRAAPRDRLVVRKLSEIAVEKLEPLWPDRFFLGKISTIFGLYGLGKSTLVFDMAARVTTGAEWPDGTKNRAPKGDVLILSLEDGVGDTIRPRLEVAGADIDRIHVIEGIETTDVKTRKKGTKMFSLVTHMGLLDEALTDLPQTKMVIIDPISGVFHGADTHKTSDVREVLGALKPLIERHHVCLIGISHPNKAQGVSAAYRNTGSLAFTAGPRTVFVVGKSQENDETLQPGVPIRCVFAQLKNNLAAPQEALAFETVPKQHAVVGSVGAISWLGTTDETPDDILDPQQSGRERGADARTDGAREWLERLLAPGPQWSSDMHKWASDAGIGRRSLDRALIELDVIKLKVGTGGWQWSLPKKGEGA